MKYYHNNETDAVESTGDVRRAYEQFGDEYTTFSDFLSACMWWNNGALTPISDYITKLEKRLGFITHCAIISNEWELYQDEIDNLTQEIEQLNKYRGMES